MTNITIYHQSWLPTKLIEAAHREHRDISDYYLKTGEKVKIRLPTGKYQETDVLMYCMPKKDVFSPIPEPWKTRILAVRHDHKDSLTTTVDQLFDKTKKCWRPASYLRNNNFYYAYSQNKVKVVNNANQVREECKTFCKSFQSKKSTTWQRLHAPTQKRIQAVISDPKTMKKVFNIFFSHPNSRLSFNTKTLHKQIENNQFSKEGIDPIFLLFPKICNAYLHYLVAYFEKFKKYYPPRTPEQKTILDNFEKKIAERIFYATIMEKPLEEFSQEIERWKKLFSDLMPYARSDAVEKLDKNFKKSCKNLSKKVSTNVLSDELNCQPVSFENSPSFDYLGSVDWQRKMDITLQIHQNTFHWKALDHTAILPTATFNAHNLLYSIYSAYTKECKKITDSTKEAPLLHAIKTSLEQKIVAKKLDETLGHNFNKSLKNTLLTNLLLTQDELTQGNLEKSLQKNNLLQNPTLHSDKDKLEAAFVTVRNDKNLQAEIQALNHILDDANNYTNEKLLSELNSKNLNMYAKEIREAFKSYETKLIEIYIRDFVLPSVAEYYGEQNVWKNPTIPYPNRFTSKTLTLFTSLAQQGIRAIMLDYHVKLMPIELPLSIRKPSKNHKRYQMVYSALNNNVYPQQDHTGFIQAHVTLNHKEESVKMKGEQPRKSEKPFLQFNEFSPSDPTKTLASFEYRNAHFDLKTGKLTFDLLVV